MLQPQYMGRAHGEGEERKKAAASIQQQKLEETPIKRPRASQSAGEMASQSDKCRKIVDTRKRNSTVRSFSVGASDSSCMR